MKQVQIAPIPERLTLRVSGETVFLPADIRKKVDAHWRSLVENNPKLRNGEVFTVVSIEQADHRLEVILAETDYAHYLYSQQIGGLGEHSVRIIHPAALVLTSDNMVIFGAMGKHTSRPGIMQCCGGGIDHSDIREGAVDIDHAMTKELSEELGLDVGDKGRVDAFYAAYLKSGGPTDKMTVCYIVRLKQTADEFRRSYNNFAAKLYGSGEEPEFEELLCLRNDKDAIREFVAEHENHLNEYMPALFYAAHGDL